MVLCGVLCRGSIAYVVVRGEWKKHGQNTWTMTAQSRHLLDGPTTSPTPPSNKKRREGPGRDDDV